MRNKSSIILAIIGMLALGSSAWAQIQNGGFETWGTITSTGTYSYGMPSNGWATTGSSSQPQVSNPMQVAGLTSGSNYAAVIQTGTAAAGYGTLQQTLSGTMTSYKLSFDIAFTQAGTSRSSQIWIGQNAANSNTINLIVNGSSTAGKMGLQLRDTAGAAWIDLGSSTGINASTYNSTTGLFTSINTYRFTITANNFSSANGALSYNIAYGTVINDVYTGVYQSADMAYNGQSTSQYVANGLGYVGFLGAFGGSTTATPYIVDNVTVSAIPEPTSLALMAGGLLLLCGRQVRRKY